MNIGDKVQLLDDVEEGVIVSIDSENVIVLWDNGFEDIITAKQLILVKNDLKDSIMDHDQPKDENRTVIARRRNMESEQVLRIDLHASAILSSTKGMSNHEILQVQLRTLEEAFNNARRNRFKKMIVIHGVGKGKLKEEVEVFLYGCQGINFHDASFKEYGQGATEVEFYKYS